MIIRRVVEACHKEGAKVSIQLQSAGPEGNAKNAGAPITAATSISSEFGNDIPHERKMNDMNKIWIGHYGKIKMEMEVEQERIKVCIFKTQILSSEMKRNVNSRSLLVAQEEDLIRNLNPKITGWKNYYSTKTNAKWMQAIDWYIICTFTRWYNKKHQRRNRMSKVGFVRNSIYEKGLRKMAGA